MNRIFFLVFFLINIVNTKSQNRQNKDSTSILSFTDRIIIKTNINTQTDSYSIQSENGPNLQLFTNSQLRLVLSLDYEFIGASIGFSPKFLPGNNDNNLKGKSAYKDHSFRFFLGNWTQEFQYKKVKSFYVENTKDLILDWIEGQDMYLQFPDFKTVFWGGYTSYVLNPKFSLRNVVYNTEWQRKSAGSFVPTFRYGYTQLSGTIGNTQSYENMYDIAIAPDYYYTAVIQKKWFVSFYASPSFGIRFSENGERGIDAKENNIYFPLSFDGGLQLGYSSHKFIYGANLKFETTWCDENSMTNITNNVLYAKIYFGYRFDTPKKVKKTFNWINKKLGL